MKTFKLVKFITVILIILLYVPGVQARLRGKKVNGKNAVADTINRFKSADKGIDSFFNNAYGYVVFPKIRKGGMGIGGGAGKGKLFENGKYIGDVKVKQLTVGFQLGVQAFSEIIFFKDKLDLENFKRGNFELGAQASAVAIKKGVAKSTSYNNGVAVFVKPLKGLMYEATVGGQKFKFIPMDNH
jgi:lipid-binding SYLF domain-containing protein